MALRPSVLLKNSLLLGVYVVLAVAAFLGIALAFAGLLAAFNADSVFHRTNFLAGLVCALLATLIVASFHLRKTSVQLRVSDRGQFVVRMKKVLEDLGYEWIHMSDVVWRTRPAFRSLVLGEGITMVLDGRTANITGPSLSLDRIRRGYRMSSCFETLQESISDSRPNSECFLKRFELSLRLEPGQLKEFQSRVVETLGKEAEIVLEVQMLVSSADGIRESLWAEKVRPWLEESGVYYDFHKDHPQRITLPANISESGSLIDTCVWS